MVYVPQAEAGPLCLAFLLMGTGPPACPLIHHPTPSSIPCGCPCPGPPLRSHESSRAPFTSNQTHHRHQDDQAAPTGRSASCVHSQYVPHLEQPPLNASAQTLRIRPHSASRGQTSRTSPWWASVPVGRMGLLIGRGEKVIGTKTDPGEVRR